MGHETLHVDTLNQGERTFIYEYIDCAETKMHAEVIRRIITTPGFQINRQILNRPNIVLNCLRYRASIEILRILIQHPDFDINTKSCCGECKDCGECTIFKGYVLFARQNKEIPGLFFENGYEPTNLLLVQLKVVLPELQ